VPDLPAPPGFGGAFFTDLRSRAAYAEGAGPYRIVPDAVALPRTSDDVRALVRQAAREGWALVPRGAGSGIPGGNIGRGVIVDLQRFDEPLDVADGHATVGAAVTWRDLDQAAEPHGWRLPPDPSSSAYCTLGGMAATNASGAHSLRFGSMRHWVEDVEMVTGDAEIVRLSRHDPPPLVGSELEHRFAWGPAPLIEAAGGEIRTRFPRTTKNSAGYALDAFLDSGSLVDLVVGSEGTLGVIMALKVRLAPRPASVASLLVGLHDLEQLPTAIACLTPSGPTALELLDRSFLQLAEGNTAFPVGGWQAALLLDFEGDDPEVRGAVGAARQDVAAIAAFTQSAFRQGERETLWSLRHAASPTLARLPDTRRSMQVIEDGCVPVEHLGTYLRGVHAAAAEAGIEVVAFGHAGDGHLHVNALVDTTEPGFGARLERLLAPVTALVVELGGTPSGEHGDGRLRVAAVGALYGERIVGLFRSVKAAFDPAGVFNPGVIFPGHAAPAAGFKVGPEAEPIPADIAARLRQLERGAGWAIPKLELLRDPDPR
jgi:FAD/FMN-containing dehydrogenase